MRQTDIVVSLEINERRPYRVRQPVIPKEGGRLHRLFPAAKLDVQFRPEHQYPVAINQRAVLIGGMFYEVDEEGRTAHLEKIVVAERYRKLGLSDDLMNEFFNRLRAGGREDPMLKATLVILFAAALASVVLAGDITAEDIPVDAIEKRLAENWSIQSLAPAGTVSGWNRLKGSKGMLLVISRVPYDLSLHRTKAGDLEVSIPEFHVYVFPSDFEGEHVNTAAVFRRGEVSGGRPGPVANRSMLIVDRFEAVGDLYVFHDDPTFPDWKTPVVDIISTMK